MDSIPSHNAMRGWTLLAIQQLGGSGHISEIDEQVKQMLQLPETEAERLYTDGRRTVLAHRTAFARSHLKTAGWLDNPQRGLWVLTNEGAIHASKLGEDIAEDLSTYPVSHPEDQDADDVDNLPTDDEEWKDDLLTTIQNLSPAAFERLCQRLLRESGFVQVTVTGRSGDGGIDGHGVLQMARLVSFPVMFQCKRWRQWSVGPGVVRDFRGAMQGRADRGLIITTSTFTAEARKEAVRDGAPPIDLVEGFILADNLRDLKLGVKEIVAVDHDWFNRLQSWADAAPAANEVFDVHRA